MPGHTHAAMTAYGELTCDVFAPSARHLPRRCRHVPVLDERGRRTNGRRRHPGAGRSGRPGPYLHLGGDEVTGFTDDEYVYFVNLTSSVAHEAGKTVIGWQELGASSDLPIGTVGQYWGLTEPDEVGEGLMRSFLDQGGQMIISSPDVAYLDQSYPDDSSRGAGWAGPTGVAEAYDWDPAEIFDGVGDVLYWASRHPCGPRRSSRSRMRSTWRFLASPRSRRSDGHPRRRTERPATSTSSDRAWSPSSDTSRGSV